MNIIVYVLFVLIIIFKIVVSYISRENERTLLYSGAREYGKEMSRYLLLLNAFFYFSVLVEMISKQVQIDFISYAGIIIVELSFVSLLFIIKILDRNWTTKIIVKENHDQKKDWVFRTIKHPEIFLITIPEIIGTTLAFHAWWTFVIVCVPYSICLLLKSKQENILLTDTTRG